MKKLFVIFVLLQNLYLAQGDWTWQNALPQGYNLNSVQCLNENLIIAVGDASTFIKSSDGGITWSVRNNIAGTCHQLSSVFFIDNNKGFIVSKYNSGDGDMYNGWLFKTTNGGNEWSLQTFDFNLDKIFFIDSNHGWMLGNRFAINGKILYTSDGGTNWIQSTFTTDKGLNDIFFTDSKNGWATGNGIIIKTTDGGINWNIINENSIYLRSINFIDQQYGWVVGHDMLLNTTDGGISWQQQSYKEHIEWIEFVSVKFLNHSDGYVVGQYNGPDEYNPIILSTNDGGKTWIAVEFQTNLHSIDFSKSNTGIAVGQGGLIVKSSDGINWEKISKGSNGIYFHEIKFINENTGWIIGYENNYSNNIIYKTTDAGNTWLEQYREPPINYCTFQDFYFMDEMKGCALACGQGAAQILRTTDGGASWKIQKSIGDAINMEYLHCISFADSLNGLAVGTEVLRSTDGGVSWDPIALPSNTYRIYDIEFVDSSTAYAIGDNSCILKTTDLGSSWTIDFKANMAFRYIQMLDKYKGLVYGNSRTIVKKLNKDDDWNYFSFPGFNFIKKIFFVDKNSGWVIGSNGKLVKTTDGGLTWHSSSIKYPAITDLFFTTANDGWMCGQNGIILNTTNGGVTSVENNKVNKPIKNYFLSQNYPNPFNPITTIEYSIPEQTNVTLKIFDLLGREITTLVNEEKPLGNYKIEFNASSLPSGVYFYRLETGKFSEIKKLLVIR